MSRAGRAAALALGLTLGAAALPPAAVPAAAQVRASEEGSVSQTVDGTVITLEYSRPVARGRDSLFGGVVDWNRAWTPGANWATTLEASKPIRVNGEPLPKGKYSVWMVPREAGPWDVVFHEDARRFHTQRPDSSSEGEVLRVAAAPETGAHMETLTWYFPVVTADGATLRMHWGRTIVPLRIAVEPSEAVALPAGERRPYLGRYAMTLGTDTSATAYAVEVFEAEGRLRARMEPPVPGVDAEFDLIPASARPERDHRFNPGWYQEGVLLDVHPEVALVFDVPGARATGFELWARDRILGRARRAPEP